MTEYWVTAVRRHERTGRITHLKIFRNDPVEPVLQGPYLLSLNEVVAKILAGHTFYTATPAGNGTYHRQAAVSVYLHSWPDDSVRDNLDSLPPC